MIDRRNFIGGAAAMAAAGLPLRGALAAGGKVFVNSIALEDDRVWIAAKIGDKGPYFFVVDTGADVSMIEDSFAKSLGLSKMPGRRSIGIGGVSDYSWYNAGTVTLASGIRFPDMLFAGMRTRPGKDAVGTFGAGLFTTYDSDLDFVKGEWRAYPDGRPDFDGLVKLKSRFADVRGGQQIIAAASIDGFDGDFLMDTGAPGEISLYGRAAAKSGLWDDNRPYAPMASSGIGKNRVPGRMIRGDTLKIGPFPFEKPLVRLSEPGTPSGDTDGIIGLKTLGRLNLTTNVSQNALYVAPNDVPAPRGGYPLSGLWLNEADGHVVIDDVGTGSPAAAAGLKKGDVLHGGDLQAMVARINGGTGKQVTLTVESRGTKREVSYTLAPWL